MKMKSGRKSILCFSAAALLLSVLAPLSAFADGTTVTSDTYNQSLSQTLALSNLVIFKEDTAYTDVSTTKSSVKFSINGLDHPFNLSNYQRVAWTKNDNTPSVDNILSAKVPRKTGTLYEATSSERLDLIRQKVKSGDKIYGWILPVDSTEWSKAGYAEIKY
ncbi:hypothetical protein B4V02_22615 [Paenibacillus kribbensis]|uniref:Surface layer protein A domain-containing protein n=1 Tax=Paenibacillus kribbensis TaxID=172713 RepID=A0A222WT22_9BACL|nr:hypothetical protein [Paenibacillus kribbensis]ASR49296.1 hypothetical protein B4V02_22615 [Paenibacillus kribbensis]